MNKKIIFGSCVVLLMASAMATAAGNKPADDRKQYQVNNNAAIATMDAKAAARIDLPAAARGISGINAMKPQIALPQTAADRLGNVGAAAAAAEQARGLREAQQAVKEMANLKGIKNLGDINNLDGLIGRHDSNNLLDGLGNRPRGHGRSDYIKDNPYGPSNTHDDGSGKYTGGGLMPLSPRDSVGPGGIGLVSQGQVGVIHGDTVWYGDRRRNADGSTTYTRTTYNLDSGEFILYFSRTRNADGSVRSWTSMHVVERTDGVLFFSDTTKVYAHTVEYEGGEPTTTITGEHELGTVAGDPSPTNPNIDDIPTDDPYATGGRPMPCGPPTPDYICAREAQAQANSRVQPTLVNPGDADLAQTQLAPQLAIDTQGLVTNPRPGAYSGGGFNPPPGWQPGENSSPGANPGPGGMPQRPGSKP